MYTMAVINIQTISDTAMHIPIIYLNHRSDAEVAQQYYYTFYICTSMNAYIICAVKL